VVEQPDQASFTTTADYDRWVKSVWQVVEDIPRGHVLTYGEVARLAGMSRAARRVSQAMRRAPRTRKLPWHRVVNAAGKISFPVDSEGYRQQKKRLECEGVVFVKGKIDLERHGYKGALDHLLWNEPP
jgi:methylated-DNA-protein-cysteine methyltransferase-like protein